MPKTTASMYIQIAILAVIIGAIGFALKKADEQHPAPPAPEQAAAVSLAATSTPAATSTATTSPAAPAEVKVAQPPRATTTVKKTSGKAINSIAAATSTPDTVRRIEEPYSIPPLSSIAANNLARAATVNILCTASGGLVQPISGSGVIIDPKGVILTNAHVAQYVLLAESGKVNLKCAVRTGSPAVSRYIPGVLYLPPVWLAAHSHEITTARPLGTGEHDYALLYIASMVDGTELSEALPFLTPDVREGITFVDDHVIVASYPAEFLGGLATANGLYAASSITAVKQLLTFNVGTIDVISVGGVITAQSGSSGGPVVNAWGRVVGLITTTSAGATTAERDLRAITLSYINRDIEAQAGFDLTALLRSDPELLANDFNTRAALELVDLLLEEILRR